MSARFLLTPLREGRLFRCFCQSRRYAFLLTPLREGRPNFQMMQAARSIFLLTPLREGRRKALEILRFCNVISTHAPAGGATVFLRSSVSACARFLLTPLREGRPLPSPALRSVRTISTHAPAGGATAGIFRAAQPETQFLLTPLREGRPVSGRISAVTVLISTHAPAGGATAIFHKSVMRFCGKLPKDDTVLCLASFGFPRRDPKAVYLAWISCANLPQKCVRQGLALKDQGTSCFHVGLASHAFDPVLV